MQAFQAAWAEACKVQASTMVVPSDYVFFVGPISFSGPYCKSDIVFQVTYLHSRNQQREKEKIIIKNIKEMKMLKKKKKKKK